MLLNCCLLVTQFTLGLGDGAKLSKCNISMKDLYFEDWEVSSGEFIQVTNFSCAVSSLSRKISWNLSKTWDFWVLFLWAVYSSSLFQYPTLISAYSQGLMGESVWSSFDRRRSMLWPFVLMLPLPLLTKGYRPRGLSIYVKPSSLILFLPLFSH